jgi:hypothetical protein
MPQTLAQRKASYHAHREERCRKQSIAHAARLARMTPEELAAYRAERKAYWQRYNAVHGPRVNRGRSLKRRTPEGRAKRAADRRKERAKDPERTREKSRATYAKDPARAIAAVLKWAKAHPDQVQANCERRRARIRGAARNDVTAEQRQAVLAAADGRCVYCPYYNPTCKLCTKRAHKRLTVDHITSIIAGGDNTLHNLVACCGSCNSKKSRNANPVPVQPLLL